MNPMNPKSGREFLSHEETDIIVDNLRKKRAFSAWDSATLTDFVRQGEVVLFGHHEVVWRQSEGQFPYLIVLLEGCLAAWSDTWDESSVDFLITEGQLFGEAEFLGFDNTFRDLVTLMNSRLLVFPLSNVKLMVTQETAAKLYDTLSVSLVEKLRAQNYLLKVRTGQNERRLVKFLDNFTRDPGLRTLTNIKSKFQKDDFRINIFFNPDLISGLLCSVSRQIAPVFKNFIEWNILRMFEVDENFNVSGVPVSADRFPKSNFPNFPYFQLELVDHRMLMRVLDGTK